MTILKFVLWWFVAAGFAGAAWAWFRRRDRRRRWTDWQIGTNSWDAESGKPNRKRGRVWDEQERLIHRDKRDRKKLRIVQ